MPCRECSFVLQQKGQLPTDSSLRQKTSQSKRIDLDLCIVKSTANNKIQHRRRSRNKVGEIPVGHRCQDNRETLSSYYITAPTALSLTLRYALAVIHSRWLHTFTMQSHMSSWDNTAHKNLEAIFFQFLSLYSFKSYEIYNRMQGAAHLK